MAEVSFEDAVNRLQSMFSGIDRELISAVLESNGYHMERTVEQLLQLDPATASAGEAGTPSGGAPSGRPARAPAPAPPPPALAAEVSHASTVSEVDPEAMAAIAAAMGPEAAAAAAAAEEAFYSGDSPPDAPPAVARGVSASSAAAASAVGGDDDDAMGAGDYEGGASGGASGDGRVWRHPIDDDFLRVPGRGLGPPGAGGAGGVGGGQLVEDDIMAQMMADELFLEELRSHPEFAAYLQAEGAYLADVSGRGHDGVLTGDAARRAFPHAAAAAGRGGHGGGSRERSRSQAGASMAQKLGEMGDEMKRKFNSLMLRFNTNRTAAAGGGSAPRAAGAARPRPSGRYATLDDDDDAGTSEGTSLLAASASDGAGLHTRTRVGSGDEEGVEMGAAGTGRRASGGSGGGGGRGGGGGGDAYEEFGLEDDEPAASRRKDD